MRCGCYVKLKALHEGPEAEGVVTSVSMAISASAKLGEGGGHVAVAGRSSSQELTISPCLPSSLGTELGCHAAPT